MSPSQQILASFLLLFSRALAVPGQDHGEVCKCPVEAPSPTYDTITFTVVATVDPSIHRWDQLLDHICPTPWPVDTYPVSDKSHGHKEKSKGYQKHGGYDKEIWSGSGAGDYESLRDSECYIQYLDRFWWSRGDGYHGFRPPHWITWYPMSSTAQTATSTDTNTGSSALPGPSGSTTQTSTDLATDTTTTATSPTSTQSNDGTPSSTMPSSPVSSTPSTTPSTTTSTSSSTTSTTSSSPTQTCENISNGSFENDNLDPWFISEEVTADSQVIQEGPPGVPESFALIPSQQQYAQVYLNQYIPRCNDPPPRVDLQISFQYQFTGDSVGCSIAANVNREAQDLFTIVDDGQSNGAWQQYQGPVISVQLTYDSLFTLKLVCEQDTANAPAILITQISVY